MSGTGIIRRILKRLRLVVNPELIESDVWANPAMNVTGHAYRTPAPANQSVNASSAAPQPTSNNYYFARDARRSYPKTVVYLNPTSPLLGEERARLGCSAQDTALPAAEASSAVATKDGPPKLMIPPSYRNVEWVENTDSGFPEPNSFVYYTIKNYSTVRRQPEASK